MQNITLALPKELLQDVKELASSKNVSVSKLLSDTLEELLRAENGYQHAMERSLKRLDKGFYLGFDQLDKPFDTPLATEGYALR